MNNNAELKPCPFCGGKAHLWFWLDLKLNMACAYAICDKCSAKTGDKHRPFDTASRDNPGYGFIEVEKDAIREWNKRYDIYAMGGSD